MAEVCLTANMDEETKTCGRPPRPFAVKPFNAKMRVDLKTRLKALADETGEDMTTHFHKALEQYLNKAEGANEAIEESLL